MDINTLRHSCAHVLAAAVKKLYPGAKLGIGPAIESGFYYDFDINRQLTPEDLPAIEEEMHRIIKADEKFQRLEVTQEEAVDIMKKHGEKYKIELITSIGDEKISLYKHGDFTDLCRGPHLESSGQIKAFRLLSVAGSYWRGIETNPVLQRVYGTAFFSPKELKTYLNALEEAKKRDHRKLGKELDLFSIHEEAGAGFVYYHPKGAMVRNLIEDFLRRENLKRGYELVYIPHIAKIDLYHTSGHTDYYRENMYFMNIDQSDYVIKPMNCPGHIMIYKRKLVSYRDLPVRFFELGTVYRYEKSGVLHGLLRVRGFTQDDAHIFCRFDQLKEEILSVLEFINYVMKVFNFEYEVNLSTRPEKFAGSLDDWSTAEDILRQSLLHSNINFEIDPGAGVFYGPKIDIKIKDAIGRLWQGPTVQVDFNLPRRFELSYIAEDGLAKHPVLVHRAILGSMERFLGALIEHYAGAFPLWLAPVQAVVLNVTSRTKDYAEEISRKMKQNGIRLELDARDETLQKRLREQELNKVPYMIVVGDREQQAQNISVRRRGRVDLGIMRVDEFISLLKKEGTLSEVCQTE